MLLSGLLSAAILVAFAIGPILLTPEARLAEQWWQIVALAVLFCAPTGVAYLVTTRQPANPLGWLMLAFAGGIALGALADAGAVHGNARVTWLSGFGEPAFWFFTVFFFVLFPSGRLPSRRWRPVVWIAVVAIAVRTLSGLFAPGPMHATVLDNPFGLASLAALRPASEIASAVLVALSGASVVSVVLRWRSATGDLRQQLNWLAAAAVVLGLLLPVVVFSTSLGVPLDVIGALMAGLILVIFPGAIGMALLRHRAFAIDLVLRRTVVFAAAWLVIGLAAAGLTALLGRSDRLAQVGLAAAAVAGVVVGVAPARERVAGTIERWVFGSTRNPYTVVARFSARLNGTDSADVAAQLVRSVQRGLGLRWARVHLAGDQPAIAGPAADDVALAVPIDYGGVRFGVIDCGPKIHGIFSDRDAELLHTLAGHTALTLANARLAVRVVQAQEAERRRIERNLHDGVQQQVVALVSGLGLALEQAPGESDRLRGTLGTLRSDAVSLLRDLRELAGGIHPSLLTDGGLVAALAERCGGLATVAVHAEVGKARYADEIEGAAYFVVMEALANALKYAGASGVTITLRESAGRLEIEVADSGSGFDPELTRLRGLAALADRVAALGGTFEVVSGLGRGTAVRARVPATQSNGEHDQ